METSTMLNLPEDFINSLSADELEKLRNANNDFYDIKARYKQWCGDDDLKAHIEAVGAAQRAEQEHAQAMRERFK